MKKQPEITDATREALITAFFQLARTKNINQITIREITTLAGYNRTTFYRYFEDVYALMEYAEDDFLRQTKDAMEQRCREDGSGERQFFETLIRCFHENADRVCILLSEQYRSHFLRRITESVPSRPNITIRNTPKKKVIKDIYFYGIFHAISINLQNRDALPDEDLLDLIQELFENWYWPEMTEKI